MVNGLLLVRGVIFCAYRVGICYGKFPAFLLEAWDDSDFRKESNNDRPSEKMSSWCIVELGSGTKIGGYVEGNAMQVTFDIIGHQGGGGISACNF